jgi:hypothetical protein
MSRISLAGPLRRSCIGLAFISVLDRAVVNGDFGGLDFLPEGLGDKAR